MVILGGLQGWGLGTLGATRWGRCEGPVLCEHLASTWPHTSPVYGPGQGGGASPQLDMGCMALTGLRPYSSETMPLMLWFREGRCLYLPPLGLPGGPLGQGSKMLQGW